MKRLFAVGLILAVLAVGLTALADPIVVGGSDFTTSSFSVVPGNGYGIPVDLGGVHLVGKPAGDVYLLCSPIVVGGS